MYGSCVFVVFCFFFFFFKQKPAYEMRISDWSSDVCSSDLNTGRVYTVAVSSLPSARGDGQPVTSMMEVESGSRITHMIAGAAQQRYVLGTQEIGRASCRERVCQYV